MADILGRVFFNLAVNLADFLKLGRELGRFFKLGCELSCFFFKLDCKLVCFPGGSCELGYMF